MSKKVRVFWTSALLLLFSNFFLLQPMLTMRNDQPKATWLWHTFQITEEPDQIIEFLDKHHVSELYLQVNENVPYAAYQYFIRRATESNVTVYALDGAPHWAVNRQPLQHFFDWVAQYQESSNETERFSGIHLDIEPYILPGWHSEQQEVIRSFQESIQFAADASAELNLPFGMDIPFWFDERNYSNSFGNGVLSEWLIDQSDSITIMAYRNQAKGPNGIIGLAQNEVRYADSVHKEIRVGVETGQSYEGDYLSFYGKTDKYLTGQLKETEKAFNRYDAFHGIAIHSLESWRER